MSNPIKQKGTKAETRVVRYLTSCGVSAKRRPLSGNKDQGDIEVDLSDGTKLTIEVKAGKQTANYNRAQFEDWLRQTVVEGDNAECDSALVIVRYRRSLDDAEVFMPNGEDVRFVYLDHFAELLADF